MLRLTTFGGLRLEDDEGHLTGAAAQRRRLVLLAALAAAGQKGMTRDAVVVLVPLGPDAAGSHAGEDPGAGVSTTQRSRSSQSAISVSEGRSSRLRSIS